MADGTVWTERSKHEWVKDVGIHRGIALNVMNAGWKGIVSRERKDKSREIVGTSPRLFDALAEAMDWCDGVITGSNGKGS